MGLEKIKKSKTTEELLEFGIINIDKPSGPTSFKTSEFVKKALKLRKTSHFGTLDPKVTGVLPVALNRACKLTGYFISKNKTYIGVMRVHEERDLKEVQKIINSKFIGAITQKPPVRSRVKRQDREREIHSFELLEQGGKDILFKTEVQGGTYIRKLIHDLGEELGVGAHMLELRRTQAGIFSENAKDYPIVSLYDFEKAVEAYKKGDDKILREMIIPGEIISELHPVLKINDKRLAQIFTGKSIKREDLEGKPKFEQGDVVIVFSDLKFIGIYEIVDKEFVYAKSLYIMQPIKN